MPRVTLIVFSFVLLYFQAAFAQKDVSLGQAAALEAEGRWEEAANLYQDYLKKNKDEKVYDLLFNLLKDNGDIDGAEKCLKEAIKAFPQRVELPVVLYNLYRQNSNEKKAEKQFERILKNLKANNSDIQRIGNAFMYSKNTEQAKKVFLKGRELLHDKSAYGFQLGNIFLQEGDYESIAKEYLLMLEENPLNIPRIQTNLAALFAKDSANLIKSVETNWEKLYKTNKNNLPIAQFGLWLYCQADQTYKAFEMAKQIDRTFDHSSGATVADFASDMDNAERLIPAEKAYKYIIDKGEENVFYQRCLSGYANVKYKAFMQNPSNKKPLDNLLKLFDDIFNKYGFSRDNFTPIMQDCELLAFHAGQPQKAVDILSQCIASNSFSTNQKAEMKLLSAEIYNVNGDSWQASLLCWQVEKDCPNSPLSDKAKFFKAMLSYYNGEIEWALSQFKALRASTTKLIANDALEYSVLIEDSRDDDSTFRAMQWFAYAEREREYRNYDKAEAYLDTIMQSYLYHPVFDECIYLRAVMAKEQGGFERADSLFKELLLKYPYDLTADDALMQLADIAQNQYNDTLAAKEYYQRIILDYPTSLYVTQARKKLKQLGK